ncbi:hypothetical protein ACIPLC_01905 [Kitasatospora sp. NPDC086801]|uniref:hypothetical protein n=1 Tax=Kitasatospora sp. NPDC086801 TaxID=3364066 RepID=UPI0037F54C9C
MSTPVLNGRTIGLAHYSTRAVLESTLTGLGLTFHQQLALNGIGGEPGGSIERGVLIGRLADALKVAEAVAAATVDEVLAVGWADESGAPAVLALTEEGRVLHARISESVRDIVERVYGGLPADELAVAARVLTAVTERANAILAGA